VITNPQGDQVEILAYNPETQTVMVSTEDGKAGLLPVTDLRCEGGAPEIREALGNFTQYMQNQIISLMRSNNE
jgi:hypothetical protein